MPCQYKKSPFANLRRGIFLWMLEKLLIASGSPVTEPWIKPGFPPPFPEKAPLKAFPRTRTSWFLLPMAYFHSLSFPEKTAAVSHRSHKARQYFRNSLGDKFSSNWMVKAPCSIAAALYSNRRSCKRPSSSFNPSRSFNTCSKAGVISWGFAESNAETAKTSLFFRV